MVSDFISDIDYSGKIREETWYRWASDAAELICGSQTFSYRVAELDIVNFQAKLPKHLKRIHLAAVVKNSTMTWNKETMKSWTSKALGSECDVEVILKCPTCHEEKCTKHSSFEVDIDELYIAQRPYLKHINQKPFLGYASAGTDGFMTDSSPAEYQIMLPKVSNDMFWNTEYYLGICNAFGQNSQGMYSYIQEDDKFITDLKEGKVMLSYLSKKVDNDGYHMIPDTVEATQAVLAYMTAKFMWAEWMHTKKAHDFNAYQIADRKALLILAEASSALELPTETEFLRLASERWVVDRDRFHYGT